jgi:hypothetical protein
MRILHKTEVSLFRWPGEVEADTPQGSGSYHGR